MRQTMLEISIIVAVYTSCKLVFALLQIVTKNVEHDSANNRKSNDLKKKNKHHDKQSLLYSR
jgi:membrane-anchored glycerophosphoryl diester phosphodiesterase (GDPDase)